jgi:hypothetical protein
MTTDGSNDLGEIGNFNRNWILYVTPVSDTVHFGGRESVVDWRLKGAGMHRPCLGNKSQGKLGVALSRTGKMSATLCRGEFFGGALCAVERCTYLVG